MEDKNIIELPKIEKTKVQLEINDQDLFMVSVPTKFFRWIGKKLFGGKGDEVS